MVIRDVLMKLLNRDELRNFKRATKKYVSDDHYMLMWKLYIQRVAAIILLLSTQSLCKQRKVPSARIHRVLAGYYFKIEMFFEKRELGI